MYLTAASAQVDASGLIKGESWSWAKSPEMALCKTQLWKGEEQNTH